MQERELIEGLCRGEEGAFRLVYSQYSKRIYHVALGFTGQAEDAEDITQEVFVEVFRKVSQFRGEASLYTWMCRLTMNRSLEFLRSKKRKKRSGHMVYLSAYDGEFPLPHFEHPGILLENQERAQLLYAAVEQLPEQQRAAFTLQKMENLSMQEISEVLSTTVSAVESLLHRAKQNLRKSLEEILEHSSAGKKQN